MSVTYGFYNSLNGDRKYDATQISSMFDGLITDGVFASIGTAFAVKANTGLTVNVGIGKAWFNRTWTLNDAILPLEAPISDILLDRIDAVVLEVDSSESVRANSIKFVQGTPSSQPVRPTLASSETLHQYPLCYIYRAAGSTEITQADITNMVGTEETPFITGILQTISIDELLGQWEDEFDQWIASEQTDFTNWFNQMKEDLLSEQEFLDQWIASEQTDFTNWFNQMKDQLSSDAAGNLLNLINTNTGAIEAHKAENATLSALGHVNHAVLTTTLDTTWSGSSAPYSKTVTVSGILATDTPIIDIVMSGTYSTDEARIEAWGCIYRAVTADGSITFYTTEKPTVSLPIQIRVVR
jgi:hypothetical protein